MAQKVKNADGLKKLFTEIYKRLEATSDKSEEEKSRVLAECKDAVENTTLDNTLVRDMNYNSFTMYTKIMAIDQLRTDIMDEQGELRNEDRFEQIVNRFDKERSSSIHSVRQELDREEQISSQLRMLSGGSK